MAESVQRHVLRTCADFQTLIPAYRTKQLADAQVWLLEDHLHGCPACRNAAGRQIRKGRGIQPRRRALAPQWKWAIAAALAIGVGIGAWQMRDHLLPAPGGPRGVVASVSGVLYRVSDTGSTPIAMGTELGEREEILTARGSGTPWCGWPMARWSRCANDRSFRFRAGIAERPFVWSAAA